MLVVVAELCGYLLPQVLELASVGVVIVHVGHYPGIGARVVVNVEDAVEPGIDDIIDDLIGNQGTVL